MQKSAEVDIECAVALSKAYKAMRDPQSNDPKTAFSQLSSTKRPASGRKNSRNSQTANENESHIMLSAANQAETGKSTPRFISQPWAPQQPSAPVNTINATGDQQRPLSSAAPASKENPVRPKYEHSPDSWKPHLTISDLVSLIWQLKRLLFDTLMREDGCFSQTWMQSAIDLQSICEKFFLTSAPPIMSATGVPTVPEELNCAAAILEFIRGVNGNDCGLLMHQYSIMARRFSQCVMHLASAEIMRRKTPVYYRDALKRPYHFPYIPPYGPCGYQPPTIGVMAPNDLRWVYSDATRAGIVNGNSPFSQTSMTTHTAAHFQSPPYPNNMVPIPPVALPHYQPFTPAYFCGPAAGFVQGVTQRQDIPRMNEQLSVPSTAEMRQPQFERMGSYMPVAENTNNSNSSMEEQNSSTMPNTRGRDKPFFVGPWDIYREELSPDGVFPVAWNGTNNSTNM
ncbi:flagellar motor switch protein, putative [Babesia ovis]|uniref:Flagellar motor switch protein, putative n=1 Tax=Babesia ovis TaxID=5869 RepID=A0A9W5WVV6_BABOV|nr:flagellar motor switch protein, putative [Babesia ovis]